MLLADTIGQFVKYTSSQRSGTVVATFLLSVIVIWTLLHVFADTRHQHILQGFQTVVEPHPPAWVKPSAEV